MLLWDLFLRLDGLAGDGAVDLMEQGVQLVPADGFQLLELLALGLLAPVMQDNARDDQDPPRTTQRSSMPVKLLKRPDSYSSR